MIKSTVKTVQKPNSILLPRKQGINMINPERSTFTPPPDYIMFNRLVEKLECNADELFTWMCQGYFGDIFFTTYQNRNRPYKLDNDEKEKMLRIKTSLLQTGKPFSEFEMKAMEKLPAGSIDINVTIRRENLTVEKNSFENFINSYHIDESNTDLHLISKIYKFLHTNQTLTLPSELFVALDLWKRIFIDDEIANPEDRRRNADLKTLINNENDYITLLGGRNTRNDTPGTDRSVTRIASLLNSPHH